MSFTKIPDVKTIIIRLLPNRPTGTGYMTARALKEAFDEAAENIKNYFNNLVVELGQKSAAANIGFQNTTGVPEVTVQAAIENVQEQIQAVSQGAVADGSITAEMFADDAFDWNDVTGTLTEYASADYTSNGLKFYHCAPLQMMRVEGWVKFTPTNAPTPYVEIVLPLPVPTDGAIPLTAGVIGNTLRLDLTAKAEIRQGGYLHVYLGGWKQADRGNAFYVYVHGWYHVNEASAS